MKKLLYLLSLLVIASMILTACGGTAPEEPASPEAPAEATEAPVEATEAPTEEPTEAPTNGGPEAEGERYAAMNAVLPVGGDGAQRPAIISKPEESK